MVSSDRLGADGNVKRAVAFYRAHGFRPVGEQHGDMHFVRDVPRDLPPGLR